MDYLWKLIDIVAWSGFEHTGLLVADMLPFSNSSVIRLRAVTVSLVHTMDSTGVARVIISTAPFSALARRMVLLLPVKVNAAKSSFLLIKS